MHKRIDLAAIKAAIGSGYPAPYDAQCAARSRQRLGNAADLTQFGVNLLRLPPGTWSSQRHWHTAEDEFTYVLEGEVILVTNAGEELLRTGDCAGFKAGDPDGHHLQNRSERDAMILEVGSRKSGDLCDYPDIDLRTTPEDTYVHRDGKPYPTAPR